MENKERYKFSELSEEAKEKAIKEFYWVVICDDGHHGNEPFEHEVIREFLLSNGAIEQGYLFTIDGDAYDW